MTGIESILFGLNNYNSSYRTGHSNVSHGQRSREYVDYGSETYHSRGKMDDATRNWLIGGTIAQTFAGIIAPEDPEAARALGTIGNLATDIGLIRDYGREQEYYHREHYSSGREREVYHNSGSHWSSGQTHHLEQNYGHQYRSHGHNFTGDPLLDSLNNYGSFGSSHSESYGHRSESEYYNNGWGNHGSYHREETYHQSQHSGGVDFGWNPWIICY